MTDERRVCAVCASILDTRTDKVTGEVTYQHPYVQSNDHIPVPVHFNELKHPEVHCDFCYVGFPTWIVPAESFNHTVLPDYGSAGDWSACEVCIPLIQSNQWNALRRRAMDFRPDSERSPEVEKYLTRMFAQLRKHITGAPYRIE